MTELKQQVAHGGHRLSESARSWLSPGRPPQGASRLAGPQGEQHKAVVAGAAEISVCVFSFLPSPLPI